MKKIILLFVASLLLNSCAPPNYGLSVPEESGMKLSQLTTQEESGQLLGPAIIRTSNKISWDAQPMIAVSPDTQYVAYIAINNNKRNIYIKSIRSGTSVIQRTFKDAVKSVSYSPDSKQICFSDNSEGNSNIYMINATSGAAVQQITSSPAAEEGPVFSADGKAIFFTKTEQQQIGTGNGPNVQYVSRYYIWSYTIQTGLLTQYAEGLTPSPLADGKRLLITRINKETKNGEIWLIDIEKGSETLIIADKQKGYSSPQISPDGKTIVCVGTTYKTKEKPMNLDIYKINLDGTALTQLTFHPATDVSPKWSPDGKSIYFISSRGNTKQFYNLWKVEVR